MPAPIKALGVSRDRLKLDERWNFALTRSHHHAAKRRKSPRRRLLPARRSSDPWTQSTASSTHGQVSNLPPQGGGVASRDRLKLDERWNFALTRSHHHAAKRRKSPRRRLLPARRSSGAWTQSTGVVNLRTSYERASSLTMPVLSPKVSIATPVPLSSVSHTLQSGVFLGCTMLWPNVMPAPPPAISVGQFSR